MYIDWLGISIVTAIGLMAILALGQAADHANKQALPAAGSNFADVFAAAEMAKAKFR